MSTPVPKRRRKLTGTVKMTNLTLLSWGANSHGQLSHNFKSEECREPHPVMLSSQINAISKISVGGGHSIILDTQGKIYACGWNNHIQLGHESVDVDDTFERIWNLSGIPFREVSCGWDGTCAISNDDHLYVWGSNYYGQLGLPRDHFPKDIRPIQLELKVAAVSMGMRHTAAVDLHGDVWITGSGKHGQLGLGIETVIMDRFTKIPHLENITLIACGQHHTLAYNNSDSVLYAWGDNRFRQLLDSENLKVFNPIKINMAIFEGKIVMVKCGWTHSAALLETGVVYLWGRNNYGQLANPDPEVSCNALSLPNKVAVTSIALGSEHGLCLAADNSVWSWGWNEHGNTGLKSSEEIIWAPGQLEICQKPQKIFSGSGHNFVVLE